MYYGPSDPNQAQAELRAQRRAQSRRTLRAYLGALLRHPNEALSDIAFERPWLQGSALLAGGFAVTGGALGWTGLPRLADGPAAVPGGALIGVAFGAALFFVLTVGLHGAARVLEGEGSLVEVATALAFALLPVYVIAPAVVLRLLPGAWGGSAFFIACAAAGLWTLRLVYLAVREGERFSGTQAGLTIAGAVLAGVLGGVVVFFLTALFVLVTA